MTALAIMAQSIVAIALFAATVDIAVGVESGAASLTVSSAESADVDEFMARYMSGVEIVGSVVNSSGDRVDCVNIHRQPALLGARSEGPETQLEPSPLLRALLPWPVREDRTPTACPKGSVEMRLATKEKIQSAGSMRSFQAKYPVPLSTPQTVGANRVYRTVSSAVEATAAQTTINVWKTSVQPGDFSLTQMWVIGGSGLSKQTIEVGSQVAPNRHLGDDRPYLFVFYTPDGYQSGCYDMNCGQGLGFVKTSNVLDIGGPLPTSVVHGTQVEGTVAFYRDPANGNWILFYFDGASYTQSGLYPTHLFGTGQMSRFADRIDFGGEIYSSSGSTSTATDMGSGNLASPSSTRDGDAAYQRNLLYKDRLSGVIKDYQFGSWDVSDTCYNLITARSPTWGSVIYFGGPGCP